MRQDGLPKSSKKTVMEEWRFVGRTPQALGQKLPITFPELRRPSGLVLVKRFSSRVIGFADIVQLKIGKRWNMNDAARARLAATGAIAVDMESAAIVRAAPGVPTAVVRVISDTAYSPFASLNTATGGVRALLTLHKIGPALRHKRTKRRHESACRGSPNAMGRSRSFAGSISKSVRMKS